MSSVREQAWGIVASVLADNDPALAANREQLCTLLAQFPTEPERALFLHMQESRLSGATDLPGVPLAKPQDTSWAAPSAASEDAGVPEALSEVDRNQRISELLHQRMLMTAFQPIFDLDTNSVQGVEALSRFVSDDGATADLWFAEAASLGRGIELEFSALGSALVTAEQLPGELYVSINLSPESCLDARLPELLEATSMPLNRIVLDLTENISESDYMAFITIVAPLRARGLRVAVDESSASLGAMSRMVQLNPDYIKIGRNIITDLEDDPEQQALAAGMVSFAHRVGASLIAEGIETATELAALRGLRVTGGQGYFLGRPTVRPEDWATWAPATVPEKETSHQKTAEDTAPGLALN